MDTIRILKRTGRLQGDVKKILVWLLFFLPITVACTPAQPVDTSTAQQKIDIAWSQNLHAVWEIDWPNNPTGGLVTVETWRAGGQYRYEILEATAPALTGETLVFNGQTAWQYNRLNPPKTFAASAETLSPVTDTFSTVARLLESNALSATQQNDSANSGPATKIKLIFKNNESLTLWLETETGLPVRVEFKAGTQQGTLKARAVEPLLNPPPKLFSVGEWLR